MQTEFAYNYFMKDWTAAEIKAFRKRLNLFQKDFAVIVGVTRQYIGYLEKEVKKPSETLKRLLDCLEEKHKDKKTHKKGE